MSKESLKAIRNLLTTKYTNKEDLEKDLIILKEVIQIDNNKDNNFPLNTETH